MKYISTHVWNFKKYVSKYTYNLYVRILKHIFFQNYAGTLFNIMDLKI